MMIKGLIHLYLLRLKNIKVRIIFKLEISLAYRNKRKIIPIIVTVKTFPMIQAKISAKFTEPIPGASC